MKFELSWPNKYKKLFVEDGDYYEFAHIGWSNSFDTQMCGYITGYKEAADYLIDNAIESKSISTIDTVVFPSLFLYRQFIELSLKEFILYFFKGDKDQKIKLLKKLGHNLTLMWEEFRKLMPPSTTEEIRNTDDVVGKYILEFSKFDQKSFYFRYPMTKKLELIFIKEKRINLKHVKEIMEELKNYFGGASDYLYELSKEKSNKSSAQKDQF